MQLPAIAAGLFFQQEISYLASFRRITSKFRRIVQNHQQPVDYPIF